MKIEIDITGQMPAIVAFLKQQTEIDFDTDQVGHLLRDDTHLIVDIALRSWSDTDIRERIADLVTRGLLGRRWPTYGEQVNLRKFVALLKQAALAKGYGIVGAAEDIGEALDLSDPVSAEEAARMFPFAPQGNDLTAAEKWAFTTREYDVAIRTKVYAKFDGPTARTALSRAFPHGTATLEVAARVSATAIDETAFNRQAVEERVIEAIAYDVMKICAELGRPLGRSAPAVVAS